jgi:hypothetical protein
MMKSKIIVNRRYTVCAWFFFLVVTSRQADEFTAPAPPHYRAESKIKASWYRALRKIASMTHTKRQPFDFAQGRLSAAAPLRNDIVFL